MATESRGGEPIITDIVRGLSPAMSFFALALALERLHPDAPAIGTTDAPARERVRFRANPTLGFPAEEVAKTVARPQGGGALDVTVNFLGLYGPSSPLPPFYTERVIASEAEDGAFPPFLDFFHNRLISLLVRIWKHHRHDLRYETGASDPLSAAVIALFGLQPDARDASGRPLGAMLLPYAGLLTLYSRSAAIVASLVTYCTGFQTRIEEFVARRIVIPVEQRSQLGLFGSRLGEDMIFGEEVEDDVGKFRVIIGPLDRQAFDQLLPGQPGFAAIDDLIRLSISDPLAFDHVHVLAPGEAPEWKLGEERLGWTTWMDPSADRPLEVVL